MLHNVRFYSVGLLTKSQIRSQKTKKTIQEFNKSLFSIFNELAASTAEIKYNNLYFEYQSFNPIAGNLVPFSDKYKNKTEFGKYVEYLASKSYLKNSDECAYALKIIKDYLNLTANEDIPERILVKILLLNLKLSQFDDFQKNFKRFNGGINMLNLALLDSLLMFQKYQTQSSCNKVLKVLNTLKDSNVEINASTFWILMDKSHKDLKPLFKDEIEKMKIPIGDYMPLYLKYKFKTYTKITEYIKVNHLIITSDILKTVTGVCAAEKKYKNALMFINANGTEFMDLTSSVGILIDMFNKLSMPYFSLMTINFIREKFRLTSYYPYIFMATHMTKAKSFKTVSPEQWKILTLYFIYKSKGQASKKLKNELTQIGKTFDENFAVGDIPSGILDQFAILDNIKWKTTFPTSLDKTDKVTRELIGKFWTIQ